MRKLVIYHKDICQVYCFGSLRYKGIFYSKLFNCFVSYHTELETPHWIKLATFDFGDLVGEDLDSFIEFIKKQYGYPLPKRERKVRSWHSGSILWDRKPIK